MSISSIEKKILAWGIRVIARIKFEIPFRLSAYDFLKHRHRKKGLMERKISHSIYKKKL